MADQVVIAVGGAAAEVDVTDGRRLGVAEYGDPRGVPCFYFHFVPGSRFDPAVLVARRPAALAGVRLITVDRPGFGLSDRQQGREFADFPSDVLAVADHLGLGRFAVPGLSAGGGYALACASLILLGALTLQRSSCTQLCPSSGQPVKPERPPALGGVIQEAPWSSA